MMKKRNNPNLPEEIIVDILSGLPVKSVGRCRCVCKAWRALLYRPEFIRTHLNRSQTLRRESLILISQSAFSLSSASLSNAHHLFDEITITPTELSLGNHPRSWTRVYASCDGLLLVRNWADVLFVLNPITREMTEVPHSPFAVDPRESVTMYGFGYDSVSDDYKIVSICFYDDDSASHSYLMGYYGKRKYNDMIACVYSVTSDSWERVKSSPYTHTVDYLHAGVYATGCVNWLVSKTTDYESAILAFNLVEQKFREVLLPPSLVDSEKLEFDRFAAVGECLCLSDKSKTGLWVMKEYGIQESWTKLTVDEPAIIRPLCMFGQEQMVLLKDYRKLLTYNLKEGTLKEIAVHGDPNDLCAEVSFVESLVSPLGNDKTWI